MFCCLWLCSFCLAVRPGFGLRGIGLGLGFIICIYYFLVQLFVYLLVVYVVCIVLFVCVVLVMLLATDLAVILCVWCCDVGLVLCC